jgi:asparagine synthase (glutamine-hydrolysing)
MLEKTGSAFATASGEAPSSAQAGPGRAQTLLAAGSCRFTDSELAGIAKERGDAAAWRVAFERFGAQAPARASGDFAVAIRDREGRVHLAVDRFAVRTLCYRIDEHTVHCDERADALAGADDKLDWQAVFNYLYFHVIPAPRTIFADVARVPAGHCVTIENGQPRSERWWQPQFEESGTASFTSLRDEFRLLIRGAVESEVAGTAPVGCFLSGGTDSSTVAGLLTEVTGRAAHTYSIGFDAQGYDEMEYARIAARHFHADHHEYYVTARDLIDSIPLIAASCDQPFGNSSVVPTYHCAKLARADGMSRILGGDGGDELFGGNSRYARQRLFEWYGYVPAFGRKALLEPLLVDRDWPSRVPTLRKVARYVEQARVPMPERTQLYNLMSRMGAEQMLSAELLDKIDTGEPLRDLVESYRATGASSLVNRMLAHDWRHTLAENDLPKVRSAAALAGIPVGFPMLDNAVVEFSQRLAPELKLKGLRLRWFFKEALRGFLPDAILAKPKHGFGLPFGLWVDRDRDLKALALGSVRALGARGIVRESFIERLVGEHLSHHPAYYGELIWVFMMLEQWLRRPTTTAAHASQSIKVQR